MSTTIHLGRWKQWEEWLKTQDAGPETLFEVEIRRLTYREGRDEIEKAAIKEAILMLEGIEYRVNAAKRFNANAANRVSSGFSKIDSSRQD